VGYLTVQIGMPLALGVYWGLVLSPVMVVAFNELIIKPEEAYLHAKFGSAYEGYMSRVRRWL
jgi:protein-S-isoprenylcysteine O-methyltransferase Ste14